MRLIPALLAVALATPAIAQTPACEQLTAKIKSQQEHVFRLNVTTASQSVQRPTNESVDTRLQTLALLTAMQSNIQIAIASKCEVGAIVVDHDPDGANAVACGTKLKAATLQNSKAKLIAAYRLPECGGHFDAQAKAAEADIAKAEAARAEAAKAAAAQPKPAPPAAPPAAAPPPAPGGQEAWRRRVAEWTARRAACRQNNPDDEAQINQCAGPIPAPPR